MTLKDRAPPLAPQTSGQQKSKPFPRKQKDWPKAYSSDHILRPCATKLQTSNGWQLCLFPGAHGHKCNVQNYAQVGREFQQDVHKLDAQIQARDSRAVIDTIQAFRAWFRTPYAAGIVRERIITAQSAPSLRCTECALSLAWMSRVSVEMRISLSLSLADCSIVELFRDNVDAEPWKTAIAELETTPTLVAEGESFDVPSRGKKRARVDDDHDFETHSGRRPSQFAKIAMPAAEGTPARSIEKAKATKTSNKNGAPSKPIDLPTASPSDFQYDQCLLCHRTLFSHETTCICYRGNDLPALPTMTSSVTVDQACGFVTAGAAPEGHFLPLADISAPPLTTLSACLDPARLYDGPPAEQFPQPGPSNGPPAGYSYAGRPEIANPLIASDQAHVGQLAAVTPLDSNDVLDLDWDALDQFLSSHNAMLPDQGSLHETLRASAGGVESSGDLFGQEDLGGGA